MRFLEHLRHNPMCFNGDTDKFDFDFSPFIPDINAFDLNEIASQMIESTTEIPEGFSTVFTPVGLEWLKHDEFKMRPRLEQYVGIIPPFVNCWFEYFDLDLDEDVGVHVLSMSPEWMARELPDHPEFKYCLNITVFFWHRVRGSFVIARETTAMVVSDDEGQLLRSVFVACIRDTEDPTLTKNGPASVPRY